MMPIRETDQEDHKIASYRENQRCTIFLAYTSNMISCGVRESIKFLVKHKLVSPLYLSSNLELSIID